MNKILDIHEKDSPEAQNGRDFWLFPDVISTTFRENSAPGARKDPTLWDRFSWIPKNEQCKKAWLFRVYRGLYYPVI